MEEAPEKINRLFAKLRAVDVAADNGRLDSTHYRGVDRAIAEVMNQLSPVYRVTSSDSGGESTAEEETQRADLPVLPTVSPASARRLQALLERQGGRLSRDMVENDKETQEVLRDLFPSLDLDGAELEEVLSAIDSREADAVATAKGGAAMATAEGGSTLATIEGDEAKGGATLATIEGDATLVAADSRDEMQGIANEAMKSPSASSPSVDIGGLQAQPRGPNLQPPAPPPLVASKWATLRGSQLEAKVPVALFVLCKTVVEDDQGALYLNATAVQRVLLETIRPMPPQEQLEKVLLFEMKVKGPSAGGGITSRRRSVEDVRGRSQHTIMVCETLDLETAPLDVRQHWNWFPFRILKATIDLELQAKNVDVGRTKVLFCPDLCASNVKDKVAKVQTRGSLSRSSKLTFLQEQPIVHIVQDRRFKKGLAQEVKDGHKQQAETYQADVEAGRAPTVADPDDNVFATYPLMRLTFYLYEPPAKAMFKIVGPLFLVLYLMLINFNEFYGLRNIWDDGCPGEERDSDYLANGIGIAITAAFVVPAIRADRMKSPYISFTLDDLMAVAFLIGLALSTSPYCHWAISGCFVSFMVVVSAVVASVHHYFKCKHLRETVEKLPPVMVEASSKEVKATGSELNMSEWFHASV